MAAAARDEERLGSEGGDAERDGDVAANDVAANDAVADARAGVAWPALVRDPRPVITRADSDADSAAEDTDVGAPKKKKAGLPRGFIVGGCACRDRVAAVVHGALAASDATSFLDGDFPVGEGDGTAARRLSADHRAGATALAVLACAPRAHECALGGGRFARLLGRASWTLRLRDALANAESSFAESTDASALDPRACAFETRAELDTVPQDTSESPSFFFVPDATESDACLALWLERSAVALADARARWEPREAAEAATELAAAAAATARAAMASGGDGPGGAPGAGAGAGAGSSRDARGGSDRLRAARRVMLRRARETLDECLVAVGVLEERGGGENTL